MSRRAAGVLAVVAALLIGYIALFERHSVTSKELSARSGRVLTSFVRDKVDRLELQRKGKRVVLARKPLDDGELGSWQMVEPLKSEADQDAVDQVLGELEWLSPRRTLSELAPADAERFGLDAPRYRVRFQAGGQSHLLALGNEDVHGESVYARVDRDPQAYVVPKGLVDALNHEPGHFRDKRLFPELTVAWVRKLMLTQARPGQADAQPSELVKEGDRWWTNAPPRGYADTKRLDELLRALSDLRAARHLEPNELGAAEAALKAPGLRLQVSVIPDEKREDKEPKALSLAVATACAGHPAERYARAERAGQALIVCVRESELKPLDLGPSELREPRLFSADVSAIERFELSRGGEKLALKREGAKWKAEGDVPADREAVEAWLADLAAARATGFQAPAGFAERGSLTLELAGGQRERIAFADLGGGAELPVKRGAEPLVANFPASVFDRLQPEAARFAPLELWSAYQPSQVVKVEARADGRTRTLSLQAGTWRAPNGAPLELDRVRALTRALLDLRAHAYVSAQARPAHGLSTPEGRVQLTLEAGKSLSLELGAATERGAYARVDGRAVVEVGREPDAIVRELAGGPRATLATDASRTHESASQHDPPEGEEDEHEHDEHEHDELGP